METVETVPAVPHAEIPMLPPSLPPQTLVNFDPEHMELLPEESTAPPQFELDSATTVAFLSVVKSVRSHHTGEQYNAELNRLLAQLSQWCTICCHPTQPTRIGKTNLMWNAHLSAKALGEIYVHRRCIDKVPPRFNAHHHFLTDAAQSFFDFIKRIPGSGIPCNALPGQAGTEIEVALREAQKKALYEQLVFHWKTVTGRAAEARRGPRPGIRELRRQCQELEASLKRLREADLATETYWE